MKPEETIDFHIKRTWQSIARMYNEVAATYGGTMATGYVLLNIDKETGTPSTSLGPKMGIEATSLSRILKNLENEGLIERKPNPQDGRSVLVHLTSKGIARRKDAKQTVLQFNNSVFESISEQKLKHFFDVITTVNDMISNQKINFNHHETKHS